MIIKKIFLGVVLIGFGINAFAICEKQAPGNQCGSISRGEYKGVSGGAATCIQNYELVGGKKLMCDYDPGPWYKASWCWANAAKPCPVPK